ncbi:MAG: deoxyribonuclease V [Rhodospirillales bacterium]|nr:deoxyribonuclease V [Rhodospirillales bacterium]
MTAVRLRPAQGQGVRIAGQSTGGDDVPLYVTRAGVNAEISVSEAIALQRQVAGAVERSDRFGPLRTIAGVDVAYSRRGRQARARASAVLLDAASLAVLDQAAVEREVEFPYVPGLLSFREAPAAIAALDALRYRPDVLMCDGQGIAHPRRCGIASHLGVVLDLPTIGVAKSRLIGSADEPSATRGAVTSLRDGDEEIGLCLRTRSGVRPVFVSTGHRVSLESALRIVLQCSTKWRLPEPTRLADRISKLWA